MERLLAIFFCGLLDRLREGVVQRLFQRNLPYEAPDFANVGRSLTGLVSQSK